MRALDRTFSLEGLAGKATIELIGLVLSCRTILAVISLIFCSVIAPRAHLILGKDTNVAKLSPDQGFVASCLFFTILAMGILLVALCALHIERMINTKRGG